jgi:hypothetical protein
MQRSIPHIRKCHLCSVQGFIVIPESDDCNCYPIQVKIEVKWASYRIIIGMGTVGI